MLSEQKRKICVVTGTRAEFGNIRALLEELSQDTEISLQIVATGSHLSQEFGLTYKEIEHHGFRIDRHIEMLLSSDTAVGAAKSLGLGLISMAEVIRDLSPDLVVYLGDRYEMLSAAIAAQLSGIHSAHICGGETTPGVIDEAVRHCLTKMSTYHFPATEDYGKRIIQMGEDPATVFNCGYIGLDDIYRMRFVSLAELSAILNFDLSGGYALCTYHPETLGGPPDDQPVEALINAVKNIKCKILFTKCNADPGGRLFNRRIQAFCETDKTRYLLVDNLGKINYLSALKLAKLVIGNSSSGIVEAPSLFTPTLNVGDRQAGRSKAGSVVDCDQNEKAIAEAISFVLAKNWKDKPELFQNPYDICRDGNASYRVKETLKKVRLNKEALKKRFVDIKHDLNPSPSPTTRSTSIA